MSLTPDDVRQLHAVDLISESAEELYEQAPCGYFSCLPDGTLVKLNTTLLRWLGYERAELLYQRRFQDLLTMGGRIFYDTHFGPLLQIQGGVEEISLRLRRKDGSPLPVLVNAVEVRNPQGQPLLRRVTVFNATDRDKYEQELLLAKRKAEEASQLKARFASVVSHEIRTPLHAIQGLVDLLVEEPDPGRLKALKHMLKASADDLLALIHHVLEFSKLEAGPVVLEEDPVDMRELLARVLRPLELRARDKGLALVTAVDALVPEYVLADAVRLTQVMTNLVGNALKFTERGHVTVSLQTLQRSPESATLLVRVQDTGIGIGAEQVARIFEEYQQADYSINLKYGGTGLGLAISQQIVELYGSRIQVRSEPGVGTEFFFELSLRVAAVAPALPPAAPAPAALPSLSGMRVLVADDNEYNVFVLTQYLRRWQVEFDVVTDGEQALRQVQAAPYHVLLLDLQMPVMDGAEAVRRLRQLPDERLRALPVVAQSALEPAELRQLLGPGSFTDFLAKPFRPEQLHALLARYAPPAAPEPPAPAFRLDALRELTHGEPAAYAAVLQLVLNNLTAFEAYCEQLLAAPAARPDAAAFGQEVHKLSMTLTHLETHALRARIAHLRGLLEAGAEPAAVQSPLAALLEQLRAIIGELRTEQAGVA